MCVVVVAVAYLLLWLLVLLLLLAPMLEKQHTFLLNLVEVRANFSIIISSRRLATSQCQSNRHTRWQIASRRQARGLQQATTRILSPKTWQIQLDLAQLRLFLPPRQAVPLF